MYARSTSMISISALESKCTTNDRLVQIGIDASRENSIGQIMFSFVAITWFTVQMIHSESRGGEWLDRALWLKLLERWPSLIILIFYLEKRQSKSVSKKILSSSSKAQYHGDDIGQTGELISIDGNDRIVRKD